MRAHTVISSLFRGFLALTVAACAGACVAQEEVDDDGHDHGADSAEGDTADQSALTPGVRVPESLQLNKRGKVYLTFDDGPSVHTAKILDTLKAHNAKATFFLTGTSIPGNEDVIRREAREGHIVASHQQKHVKATMGEFTSWVPGEKATIESIVPGQPLLFRYPYGAGTDAKEAVLKSNGYKDGGIGWDIDTLDWCFGGGGGKCSRAEVPASYRSDFIGFTMDQLRRRGGGVVLMHDVQRITAQNLDAILDQIEAMGLEYAELPRQGR